MLGGSPRVVEDSHAPRYRVLGEAYRVHSALGPGMREGVSRRCLAHALRSQGSGVDVEVPLNVEFDGLRLAHALKMDLVVEDMTLLELKASATFQPINSPATGPRPEGETSASSASSVLRAD